MKQKCIKFIGIFIFLLYNNSLKGGNFVENNIEISKEELEKIHENYFWNCGGEGNIYRIPIGRHNILMNYLAARPRGICLS